MHPSWHARTHPDRPALTMAASGKLYKRLLRDRYWVGRTSRIV
jgi:hypothetical protein